MSVGELLHRSASCALHLHRKGIKLLHNYFKEVGSYTKSTCMVIFCFAVIACHKYVINEQVL